VQTIGTIVSVTPLLNQILRDPFQFAVPLGLLIGTVLAGLILRNVLFRLVRRWAARTRSQLGPLITESLRGPILLWAIMLGFHLATQNSEIPRQYVHYVPITLRVLWILSVTIVMSHLAGNAVRFYGTRVTGALEVTSLTQKLTEVVVMILGLAWLLKVVFELSLTPILTTLGVGGLAVALALQDTLSNLFAGFYVSISGLVRIGDYIKLSTGEEGYVTDINWRCTTMRGNTNNIVVVPNGKLGQAIFTNYHLPDQRMTVSVSFGVGNESDIDRVEAILLDEAKIASEHLAGMLADPPPNIRFNPGPGDYSLGFQVNFSVAEFTDQFLVQSELRKLIYKRLQKEGISMPFPTRSVILEKSEA
jgi:small-conductance mechanosensitive channel